MSTAVNDEGKAALDTSSSVGNAPFDRVTAVEQTLARARAARTRRQLGTSSVAVGAATRAAHEAGGISVPSSSGNNHPHVEKKLQRLREREEQSAVQASEHKAAMSVIATVPDPGARRQALRTMSASARVAALLTMPEQEVQQISRALSRPLSTSVATTIRGSQREAAESREQPDTGKEVGEAQFHPPSSLRGLVDGKTSTETREATSSGEARDDWIERLRQKHALPSPRIGSAQPTDAGQARATGKAEAVAGASEPTELARMTARAMSAENELQAAKSELATLHKDVELMLTTMGQVTQVCAPLSTSLWARA